MSNLVADYKVAMLIELRQLMDEGHFTMVLEKATELAADENLSPATH